MSKLQHNFGPANTRQTVQPQPLADELLTIGQAATFTQVSRSTVRRWIKGGQLKAFKIGSQVRIRRCDINCILQPI